MDKLLNDPEVVYSYDGNLNIGHKSQVEKWIRKDSINKYRFF